MVVSIRREYDQFRGQFGSSAPFQSTIIGFSGSLRSCPGPLRSSMPFSTSLDAVGREVVDPLRVLRRVSLPVDGGIGCSLASWSVLVLCRAKSDPPSSSSSSCGRMSCGVRALSSTVLLGGSLDVDCMLGRCSAWMHNPE